MAVEIDPHAGPIEPRRDLFDVSRFAGAVIAGHDNAPVARETGEDGKRGWTVETVVRIEFRDMLVRLGIGRNFEIAVDPEHLSDRHLHVRQTGFISRISCESHCSSVTSARERNTKSEARIGYRR